MENHAENHTDNQGENPEKPAKTNDSSLDQEAQPGPQMSHASLTLDDLPPANTKRWVSGRKAAVVAGVRSGLISLEDACQRYGLTEDEFNSWAINLKNYGMAGLKTTRIQHFRSRL
jgi:hypothetical protein